MKNLEILKIIKNFTPLLKKKIKMIFKMKTKCLEMIKNNIKFLKMI